MILALVMGALAAAPCDLQNLKGPAPVSYFGLANVKVEGRKYSFEAFQAELRDCGYEESDRLFTEWMQLRTRASMTCAVGTLCLWPVIIASPVFGWMALEKRAELNGALIHESAQ
jgi:hypothetical protein